MQAHHLWWIAAALAVAAELASGSFVLLMAALGLAAGALAAQAGAGLSLQLLAAALVGGGAVAAWALLRRPAPPPAVQDADPELHLDIGQTVQVERWAADGSTRVHHRGSEWNARWDTAAGAPPPAPGACVIRALRGNVLILGR